MVTPSVVQAIAACIECENSPVYKDCPNVIRVLRNTRINVLEPQLVAMRKRG